MTCVHIHITGIFESLLLHYYLEKPFMYNDRNALQTTAAALKVSGVKKCMVKAQTDLLLDIQAWKHLSPVPARSLYTCYLHISGKLKWLTDVPQQGKKILPTWAIKKVWSIEVSWDWIPPRNSINWQIPFWNWNKNASTPLYLWRNRETQWLRAKAERDLQTESLCKNSGVRRLSLLNRGCRQYRPRARCV